MKAKEQASSLSNIKSALAQVLPARSTTMKAALTKENAAEAYNPTVAKTVTLE